MLLGKKPEINVDDLKPQMTKEDLKKIARETRGKLEVREVKDDL